MSGVSLGVVFFLKQEKSYEMLRSLVGSVMFIRDRLVVVVCCCWLLLVVVGCCWLLLVVGCCWLLLVAVGYT